MNNLRQNEGLLSCPLPMADWAVKLLALCPPAAAEKTDTPLPSQP